MAQLVAKFFYFSKEHTILSYRSSKVHNSLLPPTKTKFAGFFKPCTRTIFFSSEFCATVALQQYSYLKSKFYYNHFQDTPYSAIKLVTKLKYILVLDSDAISMHLPFLSEICNLHFLGRKRV